MKTCRLMLCLALLVFFITGCGLLQDIADLLMPSPSPSPAPASTPTPVISIADPPAPAPAPAIPTPSPSPSQSDLCSGNELVCLDTMTQAAVKAQGGTAVHANFEYGSFYPEPKGGLVFPLSLNTNKPIVIEFDIQGLIFPEHTLPELSGGKVCLMAFRGGDYLMTLQRMHGGYRNTDGIFRLMYGRESGEKGVGFVITHNKFNGHYSTAHWQPGEIHHFKILLQQDGIQLSIDDYTSKKARVRSSISGNKQVEFVLGNRAKDKMGAGQGSRAMFLNLKITNQ